MSAEHYFTSQPSAEFKPKELRVMLAGREATVQTSGGVFSPDHIDTGTKVLLRHLNLAPNFGNLLDVGCGWGPIALSLAIAYPETTVWAVDVNERSLELTRANAQRLGLNNIKVCHVDDVPADVRFESIWSNPPIRVGKDALHGILEHWLPRLLPHGEAFLVVQKQLGADSLQAWLANRFEGSHEVERIDTDKGFRVIRVEATGA